MIIRNNITEVAYNVQTSVDAKNNLLIDYKVTNNNDSKAMGNIYNDCGCLDTTQSPFQYDWYLYTYSARFDLSFSFSNDLQGPVYAEIKGIEAIKGSINSNVCVDDIQNRSWISNTTLQNSTWTKNLTVSEVMAGNEFRIDFAFGIDQTTGLEIGIGLTLYGYYTIGDNSFKGAILTYKPHFCLYNIDANYETY